MSKTQIITTTNECGQNAPTVLYESGNCILMRLETTADCLWAANDAYTYDSKDSPEGRWCTDKPEKAQTYLDTGPLYYMIDKKGVFAWQYFPWDGNIQRSGELENQYRKPKRPFSDLCDAGANPGIMADWANIRTAMQAELVGKLPELSIAHRIGAFRALLDFGVQDIQPSLIDIINQQLLYMAHHIKDTGDAAIITPVLAALSGQMDEQQITFAHHTIDQLAASGTLHTYALRDTVLQQPEPDFMMIRRVEVETAKKPKHG
jgi:hypothetical protein